MKEVWAEIEGFPDYAVSNYGVVLGIRQNRKMKPRPNSQGYLRVQLWSADGKKEFYVHQLVAKAFFGDWHAGMQVKHVNGDKTDNRVSNLQLRMRRNADGTDFNPEYTRAAYGQGVRIIETGEEFRSVREAAVFVKGDYTSIYKVLRGQRLTHMGYRYEYVHTKVHTEE